MDEFIENYNALREDFKIISPFIDINKQKLSELEKAALNEESTFLIIGSLSFYMYTPVSDVDIIALTKKDYSLQMYVLQTTRKLSNNPYANDIIILSKRSEIIDPDNFLDDLVRINETNCYSNSILTDFESRTFSENQKGFLMTINRSLKKYVSRLKDVGIETNYIEKKTKDFTEYFLSKLS